MILFFELRLIKYHKINDITWLIIFLVYCSLYLGATTYLICKKYQSNNQQNFHSKDKLSIFISNDARLSLALTLFFGTIGLIGAIQAWFVLINIYGSVVNALMHLGALYQMRVQGELTDIWPYTTVFSYSGIFFAAIYSAVKSRLTLISVLPLVALIIKEIAVAGRAGILFGFVEFIFTFMFFLYFFSDRKEYSIKIKKLSLTLSIFLTLLFLIISVTLVKNLRVGNENFRGETRLLKNLDNSSIISPSIYLYVSGHLGVLNKFLEKENENYRIGENTFQFVYNVLNKFGLTNRPQTYQKPYFIPTWINTGTFIRELIADFGIPLTFTFVYFLGFFLALSWVHFFNYGNINYLVLLVFLMIIVFFSFLMMITRLANWFLTPLFLVSVISFINHFKLNISQILKLSFYEE